MNEVSLESVLAVNAELVALAEVGIPSNLSPGASPAEVAETLARISSSLTLRSNLGQPLIQATTDNADISPVYRKALEAGLRSRRLAAVLDGISRQATADDALRSTIGRSLIPPLIVSGMAYLGFMLLCLNYSPTVEGMYSQVGQPPNHWIRLLVALREWLPYWAILFPLFLLICVLLWRRGWGNWHRWLPGARRQAQAVRDANFANQLRLLVENGVPLAESLPLAAAVTGDEALIDVVATLPARQTKPDKPSTKSRRTRTLPPMLHWALTGDLGDQSLPEILRFAEKTYRQKAERRAAAWRVVLPATISAVLGGVVVLVYGMSLFGSFAQLLKDIAS